MSVPQGRISSYTHEGLTFDVRDEGPIDGEAVVLLHGFPERGTSWRHVAPLLHAHGLRTVAPDQRGYSPGARPPGRRDYRTGKLVGDVAALIGELQRRGTGPVHLVGHDWGAAVGWGLAAQLPELLRTWTAVSVPHPAAMLEAGLRSTQFLRSWYMGLFQLPALPELMAARDGGLWGRFLRSAGMTEDEVDRFRTEIVEYGALPGGLAWYRALPFSRGDLRRPVTVPTTMVWSDGDVALARAGAERTERHVHAPYELVVLEGVSHWIPTHAPEALAEAVLSRIVEGGR